MFTERLDATASGLGLPVIRVDLAMTEDDLAALVAASFRL